MHRRTRLRRDPRPPGAPRNSASGYAGAGRLVVLVVRTANGEGIFEDLGLARRCLRGLERLCASGRARVYAYCLLPDQARFLIRVAVGTPVPQFVQRWKSLCHRLSRRGATDPSIWEDSYQLTRVSPRANLLELAEEIWSDPVRRGLAASFKEYPLNGSIEWQLGPARPGSGRRASGD